MKITNLLLSIVLSSYTTSSAMHSLANVNPRTHFNETLDSASDDLRNFNKDSNLYEELTIDDKAHPDAEELLNLAILEYLTTLDIEGYSQMRLFFLRQQLTESMSLIIAALP